MSGINEISITNTKEEILDAYNQLLGKSVRNAQIMSEISVDQAKGVAKAEIDKFTAITPQFHYILQLLLDPYLYIR